MKILLSKLCYTTGGKLLALKKKGSKLMRQIS